MKPRINPRSVLAGLLLAGVVVLAGTTPACSGCGSAAPLAYVPQDALVVVVVPKIADLLTSTKALVDKFKDNPMVSKAVEQGKSEMVKEVGLDPEKPESFKTKGINSDKGVVLSVSADSKNVSMVFGVEDQATLEKFLRETITKATGGGATFKEQEVSGMKVTLVNLQGSDKPRAAWGYAKKNIIICAKAADDKVAEYVAQVAGLKESIKANKNFTALRDKMDKNQLMVYVDGAAAKKTMAAEMEEKLKTASDWMKTYIKEQQATTDAFMAYMDGVAFGLQLTDKGVALRTHLAMPKDKGKAVAEVFKGKGDAPDFGKYIGPDAIFLGRFSLDAKKLMDLLMETLPAKAKRAYYKQIERIEQETKFNVEKDLMALLSGRFAVALFAPTPDVLKALKEGPPQSPEQYITMVPVVGLVQVTDAKKAAELLVRLERLMVMGRLEVRIKSDGDRKTYAIEEGGKRMVAWTVYKDLLLVGTGDRLERTIALMDKGGDNVLGQIDCTKSKNAFKSDEGQVWYYHLAKTADLARSLDLPGEVKLMLTPVLGTLAKFSDLSFISEIQPAGIQSDVAIRLK